MKLNYIEWYLVELRRRLLDSMPLDQESSFILETKYHLESLAEEFVTNGMDPRAAEIAAIERFGSPDKIASDCLISLRQIRERRLIQFASIAMAIVIILITLDGAMQGRGSRFSSYYLLSLSPLVITFGVFALIIGKLPSWKWFALPAICAALFGFVEGSRTTFYTLPGTFSVKKPYAELHNQFGQLRTQHLVAAKAEHEAAESWRTLLASAKDMKLGEVAKFPKLTYVVQNRGEPDYTEQYYSSGIYSRSTGYSYSWTIYDSAHGHTSFRYLPVETQDDLKGPLTAHDVRLSLVRRITSAQANSHLREGILENMRLALNLSVKDRIQMAVSSRILGYLFAVGPLAFVVSFLTSKIRRRVRFKANNLRLA